MLFTVVLEFFICWTPLYTINTIALFQPALIYQNLGYTGISFLQLLAYSSSCCNPITYCFMSCGFRKAFLNLFRCCQNGRKKKKKKIKDQTLDPGADDDNNGALHQRAHSLGYHHHHSQRATAGSQRIAANGNGSVRFTTNNNGVNNVGAGGGGGGGCSSIVFSRFDPNNQTLDNAPHKQNEMVTDNNDKIQ
jgi:7 transmembrane receptor (rhodopsin family)